VCALTRAAGSRAASYRDARTDLKALAGAPQMAAGFRPNREHLLLAAVAALSAGTTITFGFLAAPAIVFVLLALVLMWMALRAQPSTAGAGWWACAAALTASVYLVYASRLSLPVETALTFVLAAAVATIPTVSSHRARQAATAVAVTTLLAMAAAAWQWGVLDVDVFNSVQNASSALIHGVNPYLTTFVTPVQTGPHSFAYATIHFQYLPGVALLAAPARLLGDVRVMSVVAFAVLTLFTVLLATQSETGRERAPRILAMSLALPMTVAMVHYALVDVYAVAGFAGWMLLRREHPRWAVLCLVVALTIKPTILIALVAPLLWSRRARREVVYAAAGAALVVLPFMFITGVAAFYQDVLGIQVTLGFRYNGLTLSAAWYALTGHLVPVWFGLLAGVLVAATVLRRRPRDVADVMHAAALLSIAAFLLAKWAFLNYYFIPAWLLMLALAGRGVPFEAAAEDIALPRPWPGALRWPKQIAAHAPGGG